MKKNAHKMKIDENACDEYFNLNTLECAATREDIPSRKIPPPSPPCNVHPNARMLDPSKSCNE